MPTTVVNVKNAPYDVYIGRNNGTDYRDVGWGNPFVIGRDGTRKECVEKYRAHIQQHPELRARIKTELRGHTLGCWCKPQVCHGDVLAQLADSVVVAVVGSRTYARPDLVKKIVNAMDQTTTVISGSAKGVDTWAVEAAVARGMSWEEYDADWDKHGKRAGYLRNEQLIALAEWVIAFWDGKSRGTRHSINLAIAKDKLFRVYFDDGSSVGTKTFIEKYGSGK